MLLRCVRPAVFVLLILPWQGIAPAQEMQPQRRVRETIDGDTVILTDGERVRLLGIDTPERGEALYAEAGRGLDGLVRDRVIRLEFAHRRRDHYRRLLAHIWIGDTLASEWLLREGLARLYMWPPDTIHATRLLAAQVAARRARRGIWALPPPAAESVYVIREERRRFHRPHCASAHTGGTRRCVPRDSLLDLGLSPCRTCRP